MHIIAKNFIIVIYKISCITLILYKFIYIYKCIPSLNAHLYSVPREVYL